MPTNVYFDHGNQNEQRLYEELIIEQLSIYGQDVYYLPRTLVNEDSILTALEQRKLKGYATDVIRDEFGDYKNSKLVEKSIEPNSKIVITPHIGGMTIEGQTKAYSYAVEKFK